MNTTLNKIKEHDPCESGWRKLLNHLGKTEADDELLPFLTILESNGIKDAVWSLRTCEDERAVRLFACDCAESVLHIFEEAHPNDDCPRKAIEVARKYANGEATQEELDAAAYAAEDAAADAARYAAYAADAARYAAAAAAAAWAAVRAAKAAARYAAAAAEREKQILMFKKYFL
jgi:Membrane protein involved in colicin uptake